MTDVYLALGSNVGDSRTLINNAVKLLSTGLKDIEQAPVYRSSAVGYTDQPDFLNTAIRGRTDLSPNELLKFIKDTEKKVGRVASFRWGPREIDIDIIFYGDQVIISERLVIPHPRFAERDFVLQPLFDLNPSLVDPASRLSIRQLLERLDTHSIKTDSPDG